MLRHAAVERGFDERIFRYAYDCRPACQRDAYKRVAARASPQL